MLRGQGRAARRGRRPLDVVRPSFKSFNHMLFMLLHVISVLVHTDTGNVFLQRSSLERASRSLADFFLGPRALFFCGCF